MNKGEKPIEKIIREEEPVNRKRIEGLGLVPANDFEELEVFKKNNDLYYFRTEETVQGKEYILFRYFKGGGKK